MSEKKWVTELLEGEGARKTGVVMGVDEAKGTFEHCIVNESSILTEAEVMYTKASIKTLIPTIKKWKVTNVAMESTSEYHLKLLFALMDAGIDVLHANDYIRRTFKNVKLLRFDKIKDERLAKAALKVCIEDYVPLELLKEEANEAFDIFLGDIA